MGLYGALYAGVSGLDSQSNAITATSNNIANVNTIGYKQQEGDFATLVAGDASGGVIGSTQQLVNQQGLIQSTTSSTDVAISGNGFIPVSTTAAAGGTALYTRAGSFTQDSLGNFVNSEGYYLQGLTVNANGQTASANPQTLTTVQISQSASGSATPTSTITLGANLDATQSVLLGSGEVATLAGDTTNASNTGSSLILPTSTNGIQPGDSFQIVTNGATNDPDVFTYGGISKGRDITTSAASGDGNGGYTLNTESVDAGNMTIPADSNLITINVANTAIYQGSIGQAVSISGATGTVDGIDASDINGSRLLKSTSTTSGPGTITIEVAAASSNTAVTSGAFAAGATSYSIGGVNFTISATGGNGSTSPNIASGSVATVLGEMATYLNLSNVNSALTGGLAGYTFNVNAAGTSLVVTNATTSQVTGLTPGSFASGPAGISFILSKTTPITALSNTNVLTMTTSGNTLPANTTSFNIGGATINVVSSGGGNGTTGPNINSGTNAAVMGEMATYLNSTAGQAALADGPLAGLKFTTVTSGTSTSLQVINNTNSQITGVSADFAQSTPTGATSSGTLAAGAADVFTVNSGTPFTAGASTLTIGGDTIVFGSQVAIGQTTADTLTNLANYLNGAGQAGLGSAYAGLSFSTDGTNLIATNTSYATIPALTNVAISNGAPTGSTTYPTGETIASQAVNVFDVTGGTLASGDVLHIGNAAITLGTTVAVGGTNTVTLGSVATYLNSAQGQTALGAQAGLTFSVSGTSLVATDPTTTAVSGFSTTYTGAATVTPVTNQTIAANPSSVLTTTGGTTSPSTFANGSVLNIGNANITMGTTVAIGSSDAATLANLVTYLNSGTGQAAVGSPLAGLVFSNDNNNLYVSNATGSPVTATTSFTAGSPSGTTIPTQAAIASQYQPVLTVPNAGSSLSIENRTYAFTGNILNATTASGDFMGSTATASDFTTASLNFLISVSGVGTSTFTYNATPNTALGQFNSLNTLVQAINTTAGSSLTASVGADNRLYIGAVNPNNQVTFSNGDQNGTTTTSGGVTTTVPGINWVQELDLPATEIANVNAGASATASDEGVTTKVNFFNSLSSLSSQINAVDPTNLISTVTNPTGVATVSINAANPENTISFADTATNSGSLVNLFGFKGQNNGALTSFTGSSASAPKLYETLTLPIAYSASSSKTDMSSGAITPQYTKDITVYDALGNSHTIAMNVVKLGTSKWAVELTAVPASDVNSTTGDGQIASGIVTFDGNGAVQTVTGSIDSPITVNWSSSVGSTAGSITVNLRPVTTGNNSSPGLTQSAASFDVSVADQNGSPVGQLTGVSINEQGYVVETFSNGQTKEAYQIPLATFNNPDGLSSTTGDAFSATIESGTVNLAFAGQNGAGTFSTSSLEQSSVDLSTQLTNLIIAQQAYGANSKVLTVADQLLQELDQIIQ